MSEIVVRMTGDHIKVKGGEYVQDLVRCKECKWFVTIQDIDGHGSPCDCCGVWADETTEDTFCSYGERRTDE